MNFCSEALFCRAIQFDTACFFGASTTFATLAEATSAPTLAAATLTLVQAHDHSGVPRKRWKRKRHRADEAPGGGVITFNGYRQTCTTATLELHTTSAPPGIGTAPTGVKRP
ncbi:MAG: hypothetical protein IT258_14800 [Saprospiraceae bacterium]|nr:hypothetical protein [Saprospiraceae bacterium]